MNIDNIEKIFNEKIKEAIESINEDVKITLLKKIASQSIDNVLNRNNSNSSIKVSAMFSGRGRAWASTRVSDTIQFGLVLEIH